MKSGDIRTLTIGELKALLADFPDDEQKVLIGYRANDYWKTEIAATISDRRIEEASVIWSDYHKCYKKTKEGIDDDDENAENVLIIPLAKYY